MIKLFASDIDGTLMNSRKEIHARDIEAVREAAERGMTVCLASGRMYSEIKIVMEQLGMSCYAICQNGASLYSDKGALLATYRFDNELASSLFHFVKAPGLVPVICASDGNYVAVMDGPAERVGRRFLTPPIERKDLRETIRGGLFHATKFSIYGDVPVLQRFLRDLGKTFGESVTASFSDRDGVDIMPAGVDKGAALRSLMSRLHISSHEAVSIGDSYNDLALFRATRHSFAMRGADEAVRRAAPHSAGSVAEALKAAAAW